jgi:ketosteroid isomerase-like protein
VCARGWAESSPTFEWIAARFSARDALDYEILAAGASGDLAYLVAIERITATAHGEPVTYALRATTDFRREAGAWRVVHRHGDPCRGD